MFVNYLKIAIRSLTKQRGYSLINISGLAIGLACCMLILLHVYSELQFDRFHRNAERLYRVNYVQGSSRGESTYGRSMPPLAAAMKEEFPEVESATHFLTGWRLTVKRDASAQTGIIARNYFFSTPETFKMFDFSFSSGNRETALKEPGSVVLSVETARTLFGTRDPIGEQLHIEAEDLPLFGEGSYVVTGVLNTLPANSHLQFDFLISQSTLERFEESRNWMIDWDNYLASTYVLLRNPEMESAVESKLAGFAKKYVPEEEGYTKGLTLQALSDIHFGSAEILWEANAKEGDVVYVRVFMLLAVFILGIACVNYVNLATGRSLKRAKEIALRKVVGADRRQMAGQFLVEAFFHALIAFFIAIGLVEAGVPAFNELSGSDIALHRIMSPLLMIGLVGLVLFVGVASGAYPALYLSGMMPSAILRGEFTSGRGGIHLRNGLVVLQFTVTVVMIVATMVVSGQLDYVNTKQLGFNRDRLVVFDINHDAVQENFINVKTELQRHASIKSVAVSSRVPGDWKSYRRCNVFRADQPESESVRMLFNGIDEDFLSTYEIDIVQGRNFSRARGSDSNAIILNETTARLLFNDSPIGKAVRFSSSRFVGVVVGISKDFHFESLHDRISPLVLGFMPAGGRHAFHGIDYFTIRVAGGSVQEAVDVLTAVHAKFDPVNPIELGHLDEWWDTLYDRDRRLGAIFNIAASLSIIIACVGLLGLAAFITEQRTKEIGLRKILGASVASILKLLSTGFAKLVLIGFLLASPLSYFAMESWLDGFAYRIEIGWWVFLIAGGLTLFLAIVTVCAQALKAALSNPVDALRYE